MTTEEKFIRFCNLWRVNSWPDIGKNLTFSNFSRRHYNFSRKNTTTEKNEDIIVPVCNSVLPLQSYNTRRSSTSLLQTLENYQRKQDNFNRLLIIRNQLSKENSNHASALLKQFKEFSLRIFLTQTLRTLTNRTVESIQEKEKEIIEKALDTLHEEIRPDLSVLFDNLNYTHASQRRECNETAGLENQKLKTDMVKQVNEFETSFRRRKRHLEYQERSSENKADPEVQLFVEEEKLMLSAYKKPKLSDKVSRRDRR